MAAAGTLPDRFHRVLKAANDDFPSLSKNHENDHYAAVTAFILGAVWPFYYGYVVAMLGVDRMANPTEHLTRKERAEAARRQEIEDTERHIKAVRQQIRNDETRRMIEWDEQFRQLLAPHRSANYRIENDPETYYIEARRRALMDAERQIVEERNSKRKYQMEWDYPFKNTLDRKTNE